MIGAGKGGRVGARPGGGGGGGMGELIKQFHVGGGSPTICNTRVSVAYYSFYDNI